VEFQFIYIGAAVDETPVARTLFVNGG